MAAAILTHCKAMLALFRICQENAQFPAVTAVARQFVKASVISWLFRDCSGAFDQTVAARGQPIQDGGTGIAHLPETGFDGEN